MCNPIIAGMSLQKACDTIRATTSPSIRKQLQKALREAYTASTKRKAVLKRSRLAIFPSTHEERLEQAKIRHALVAVDVDLALLRKALGIDTSTEEHRPTSASLADQLRSALAG